MGPKPSDSGSSNISDRGSSNTKNETGGRKNWTEEEKNLLWRAHNDALRTIRLAFNSEAYWDYLVEKSGETLVEVQFFWMKHPAYTLEADDVAGGVADDGWTMENTRQVVRAHNDAVAFKGLVFDSKEYWNYIAERVGMPLEEVRKNWKENSNYKEYRP